MLFECFTFDLSINAKASAKKYFKKKEKKEKKKLEIHKRQMPIHRLCSFLKPASHSPNHPKSINIVIFYD